jgi:L-ascorbate metabolism protein UlaG (beta-lactamase superfamily)
VGPRAWYAPPLALADLPPIDIVVISHDHYDHLDQESILELAKLDVPFYTSLGVGAHLEAWGVPAERIVELDWWERAEVPGKELALIAAPSQHFSGRGLQDRNVTAWSSFVVEGARHKAFFSGDTGLTPEYAEIARRLGRFDLLMLEVGAFHPAWGDIHLGPENALEALARLGGGAFLPVHWGTFNLAIHAWDRPAETLIELAPARSVQLVMPRLGEAVEPVRVERVQAWWREVAAEVTRSGRLPAPDEPPLLDPID